MAGALGRQVPKDWTHVDRYKLRDFAGQVTRMPVVLGVNWYSNFDSPQLEGQRYWIGRGQLGSIRGGHAICVKGPQPDAATWHGFYDQGAEGACVGFSSSRMMSLLNRTRYDARWLYHEAQKVDYWPGGAYPGASPFYEGTAVSSAMDILRTIGHKTPVGQAKSGAGIMANRWLTTVDEVHDVIDLPLARTLGAVPLLNSWGAGYPRLVWMPDETLARLLAEAGEACVVTDR